MNEFDFSDGGPQAAFSPEAETAVIGALLLDADAAAPKVLDTVAAEDFFSPLHAEFFRVITGMLARGKTVDAVTVIETMKGRTELSAGELKAEIFRCAQSCPNLFNTKAHAEIISKNSRARRVRGILAEAASEALNAENVDESAGRVLAALSDIVRTRRSGGLRSLKDAAPDWYGGLFTPAADRVDTGWPELDGILKGMWAGNLTLLAARPAVGKSAFALGIAVNAAKAGKTVDFYSCEMERGELIERIVAAGSGIPMDLLIDTAGLARRRADVDAVAKTVDGLLRLPIRICDDAALSPAKIRAQSRMTKNLGLIVVDYLQLLRSGGRRPETRNEEVGAISRELKLIAGDLKVPVLALSQLSRNVEQRAVGKPVLSDLRDSGELEQNANKILFMWETDPARHVVAVDVAKNRRGAKGQAKFVFDGAHMRYRPFKEDESPADPETRTRTGRRIAYHNEF